MSNSYVYRSALLSSRIVRIGVVQNSIAADPSDSIACQRAALHDKITHMTEAAADCGVNVLCYQEAWSEYKVMS